MNVLETMSHRRLLESVDRAISSGRWLRVFLVPRLGKSRGRFANIGKYCLFPSDNLKIGVFSNKFRTEVRNNVQKDTYELCGHVDAALLPGLLRRPVRLHDHHNRSEHGLLRGMSAISSALGAHILRRIYNCTDRNPT